MTVNPLVFELPILFFLATYFNKSVRLGLTRMQKLFEKKPTNLAMLVLQIVFSDDINEFSLLIEWLGVTWWRRGIRDCWWTRSSFGSCLLGSDGSHKCAWRMRKKWRLLEKLLVTKFTDPCRLMESTVVFSILSESKDGTNLRLKVRQKLVGWKIPVGSLLCLQYRFAELTSIPKPKSNSINIFTLVQMKIVKGCRFFYNCSVF